MSEPEYGGVDWGGHDCRGVVPKIGYNGVDWGVHDWRGVVSKLEYGDICDRLSSLSPYD